MTTSARSGPNWTQDQTIALEAALDAINDVIASYSEQLQIERQQPSPDVYRIDWLEMRTGHALETMRTLHVTDDANVKQAFDEYTALARSYQNDVYPGASQLH